MIYELFYLTFQMSLLISVFILCIFSISPFMKHRYGVTWRFSVWGVCMFFLVLPFVKILATGLKGSLGKSISFLQSAAIHSPAGNGMPTEVLDQKMTSAGYAIAEIFHSIPDWVAVLWVTGIGLMCVAHLVRYVLFKRSVKRMVLVSTLGSNQMEWILQNVFPKMTSAIPVYFCPNLATPTIIGILKPIILLPDRRYSSEEMQMILLHETAHFQRRDLWWKAFFIAVRSVYWYNPVIAIMLRCADQEIELRCDQKVIKGKGKEFRNDYGQLILEEAKRDVRKGRSSEDWALDFGCDKKQLRIRLEALFTPKKRQGRILFLVAIVVGVLLCGAVFAQNQLYEAATFHSSQEKNHAVKSTEVNKETRDVVIETPELDDYLNKIKDPKRRVLIQTYFSLPIDLIPQSQAGTLSLPFSQQAALVSNLSTDELESLVDEMKAGIPALKEKKELEYERNMKTTFGSN